MYSSLNSNFPLWLLLMSGWSYRSRGQRHLWAPVTQERFYLFNRLRLPTIWFINKCNRKIQLQTSKHQKPLEHCYYRLSYGKNLKWSNLAIFNHERHSCWPISVNKCWFWGKMGEEICPYHADYWCVTYCYNVSNLLTYQSPIISASSQRVD